MCGIRVINKGKLPVSRFGVRLRYRYGHGSNGKGIFQRKTKMIYGGCDRGESVLHFEISGCYCGRMHLQISGLYAYDYLSLFSSRRKVNEEIEAAVFPKERELYIELPSFSYRENNQSQGLAAGQGVDAHSEIRQLREYRTEDSNRYIHWNQSARTGMLVVKGYEKETDFAVELLLDVAGLGGAKASETDAFYELVSALVLGLLKRAAAVRVHWYDGHKKCLADAGVVNAGQCRDMLLKLYRIDVQEVSDAQEKAELERRFMAQGSAFRLGGLYNSGSAVRADLVHLLWQDESLFSACLCVRNDLPDGCIPDRGYVPYYSQRSTGSSSGIYSSAYDYYEYEYSSQREGYVYQ